MSCRCQFSSPEQQRGAAGYQRQSPDSEGLGAQAPGEGGGLPVCSVTQGSVGSWDCLPLPLRPICRPFSQTQKLRLRHAWLSQGFARSSEEQTRQGTYLCPPWRTSQLGMERREWWGSCQGGGWVDAPTKEIITGYKHGLIKSFLKWVCTNTRQLGSQLQRAVSDCACLPCFYLPNLRLQFFLLNFLICTHIDARATPELLGASEETGSSGGLGTAGTGEGGREGALPGPQEFLGL